MSKRRTIISTFSFLLFLCSSIYAQEQVKLGAYYFDGWTGTYPYHITKSLLTTYSNREPELGWITSTQKSVDQQILLAHDAGLSFFCFCWYNNGIDNFKTEPLNNALKFYNNSPYKNKLKFCLLVANHQGHYTTPDSWDVVTDEWISLFKSGQYLQSEGKPLIIFFSIYSLITNFGSEEKVKQAFQEFREKAKKNGMEGIAIAGCSEGGGYQQAKKCGYDFLTGYNYHGKGFGSDSLHQQVPIDSMQKKEQVLWSRIPENSKFRYIPVSTLNWDPRPWATEKNKYNQKRYYVGFSEKSVYQSTRNIINWLKKNPEKTSKDKIGLLYAWNENGEGAYLTPSKNGDNFLPGIKKAVDQN